MKNATGVLSADSVAGGGTVRSSVRSSLFVLSLVLALGVSAPSAFAAPATVYVNSAIVDDASCITAGGTVFNTDCFTTIQAGITAVADSGTVNVAAGTYVENVKITDKTNLTIQGAGQSTETGTVIEPASGIGFEVLTSNNITIQNLRVHTTGAGAHGILVDGTGTGGFGTSGGGVSNNLHIENTTIDAGGTGIWGDSSALGVHSDWFIDHNTITANEGGIGFQDVTGATVSDNEVTTTDGTNILVTSERYDLTNLVLDNNTVSGSGGSQVAVITDYNEREGGIMREDSLVPSTIAEVTFSNNTFSNWGSRAIRVGTGDDTLDTGTVTGISITGNTFQMTADTAVIGGTDAPSATGSGNIFNVSGTAKIQKAVNAALGTDATGDTINVLAGTYAENVQIFGKTGLTLQGVGDGTLIEGTGYGIEIDNSSNLTIKDLKIITNGPDLHGIYVDDAGFGGRGASPSNNLKIQNTTIIAHGTTDHEATGIYGGNATAGAHTGWLITGNRITADGGGIGLEDVTNSTVSDNISTITNGTNILWLTMGFNLSTLVVSGNTVNGSGGSQVSFLTNVFDGQQAGKTITEVTVSGNTFDTYGSRALRIGTGVSGVIADENKFLGSASEALQNESDALVNAESNWWGTANETAIIAKITGAGAVDHDPWYIDAGKTTLSNSITLTFDSNGGSDVSPMTNVAYGATIALPTAPTKSGFTFAGWNTLADGTGTTFDGATTVVDNVTVYAQWTAVADHTVTFAANGGSGSMSVQTTNVSTALTANTFTKTGYTFSGWTTVADGSGTAYADGASYPFTESTTLYAVWTINNYTLTFISDGSAVTPITQAYGSAVTAPEAPTKTGYTFASWSPAVPATMPLDGASVTAQWTAISHGSSRRATPAVPANVETPDGCEAGNKFSTTTGRNCNAATPAIPAVTTTTTNQGQVLGAATFNFTRNLGLGLSGADVTELQKILIDAGILKINAPTGYFGQLTKAAVQAFQKSHGVSQTGFVGPLTRGELNKGVTPTATNLTSVQADAIISIIESFGADASVVARVRASLGR